MGSRGNGLRESFHSAGLNRWTAAPGIGMLGHSLPRRVFTSYTGGSPASVLERPGKAAIRSG